MTKNGWIWLGMANIAMAAIPNPWWSKVFVILAGVFIIACETKKIEDGLHEVD